MKGKKDSSQKVEEGQSVESGDRQKELSGLTRWSGSHR